MWTTRSAALWRQLLLLPRLHNFNDKAYSTGAKYNAAFVGNAAVTQCRGVTTARLQTSTETNGIGSDSSMIAANDRLVIPKRAGVSVYSISSTGSFTPVHTARFFSSVATPASSSSSSPSAMEDEYGDMTSDGESYVHAKPFVLESGEVIEDATLRYQTYGELNEAKDNVLVVCHALTGTILRLSL